MASHFINYATRREPKFAAACATGLISLLPIAYPMLRPNESYPATSAQKGAHSMRRGRR